MKALQLFLTLLALYSTLFAKEDSLDKYISENKKEQFKVDYKKNKVQSSLLRDSWIAPIKLEYMYSKSNPYDLKQLRENASIKIDQPIFQSGGIYYGIKFAEASKKYTNYSIDMTKRKVVKDAISLLMQIKQLGLKEIKQKLQIKNSKINLEQKKENYLNGELDSGFLNNAIIEKNIMIQTLYDIQTNKEKLVSKFKAISDKSYKELFIPKLKILTQDEFLANNIILSMSKSELNKNAYSKDMIVAKYLPRVSLTAGYNWQSSSTLGSSYTTPETNYYNYGFRISMPLDINTFRDIEVSKLDYLKSKLVIEDKRRELLAIFEQVMQNIKNIENKKQLSVQNYEIYEELLSQTKDLYKAGYKTKHDVDLLKNSLDIQNLDIKIFEIDKQLELLTLYEMYKNEI